MSERDEVEPDAISAPRRSRTTTVSMEAVSRIQPIGNAATIPPPPTRARRGSVTFSPDALSVIRAIPVEAADLRGAERLFGHVFAKASGATAGATYGAAPRGEILLIVENGEVKSLAAALAKAAIGRGYETRCYLIDPHEPELAAFSRRLEMQAAESSAVFLLHGEFRLQASILRAVQSAPTRISLDASTDAVAKQLLRSDLAEIERLGQLLIDRVRRCPRFEISSGYAERLEAEIDLNASPIHYGGRLLPRFPLYLPAGQLIFTPLSLQGSIAADGGIWLEDGAAIGRSAMNRLTISSGLIREVEGPDREDMLRILDERPELRRIAGVGFGTNPGLISGVGAKFLELCLPGVHLLLGDLDAPRHRVAIIPRRPEVRTEREAWMVRGRYARQLISEL